MAETKEKKLTRIAKKLFTEDWSVGKPEDDRSQFIKILKEDFPKLTKEERNFVADKYYELWGC